MKSMKKWPILKVSITADIVNIFVHVSKCASHVAAQRMTRRQMKMIIKLVIIRKHWTSWNFYQLMIKNLNDAQII